MRVVLDTNILVSACWKTDGLEAQVVNLATSGEITPCASTELLAEYRDVFARKKLAALAGRAKTLLDNLERAALLIAPTKQVTAAIDEDDNRFLECAEAASAEYLVTGNLRHYPSIWEQTKIVNARRFLEVLKSPSGAIPQW